MKFDVDIDKIGTGPILRFIYMGIPTTILYLMYAGISLWKDKLKSPKWWVSWPLFIPAATLFFICNTTFNWTVGSYIYKEFPLVGGWKVKVFFTKRTQYYIDNEPEGSWKKELADFTAQLLNRYDPDHIK